MTAPDDTPTIDVDELERARAAAGQRPEGNLLLEHRRRIRELADQADDGTGRFEVDPLAPTTIRANIELEARYRRSLEASRARRPLERRRRLERLGWAAAGGAMIAGSIITGLELAPH